jgi:putative hydrolase of the HAD superfamily
MRKASVPIKGVFFDYDGVLTTDKTGSLTTCRHLSSRTGIELNVLANVLHSFNPDLSVGKRSYTEIWPEVCSMLGQRVPLELLAEAFESTPKNAPMFALANELRRSSVVGIITDNKKDRMDHLRKVQRLDELFSPIVVSAEVGYTKEDAQIFETALAGCGLPASSCLFIDNSRANLLRPQALGMHTIHFDDESKDVAGLRRSLTEVYGLLVEADA